MRLISAHIRGYGRLADAKVNLDSKVIAIVGPNESGKTTLLQALNYINHGRSISSVHRSRAIDVSDDTSIITVKFSLDDSDRESLKELDLEEPPTTLIASRKAKGGPVEVSITPVPVISNLRLMVAFAKYSKAANDTDTGQRTSPEDLPAEKSLLFEQLSLIEDDIRGIIDGEDSAKPYQSIAEQIHNVLATIAHDTSTTWNITKPLTEIVEWLEQKDPEEEVRSILWSRAPRFLFFGDGDRSLDSTYNIDDNLVQNPPKALANLLQMAGADLRALNEYIKSGDIARRETLLSRANARLAQIFSGAWKQANLTVKLIVDSTILRIVIWEGSESVTVFSERSAGLKMFVTMLAFLSKESGARPAVLLIDEAENHLHIDAQADIVSMFATQEQAVRVIYTTHSPACLPQDLGIGVRSIVPSVDNLQVSQVKNSFWQGAAGYSSLMLAMGAAAAAFTPARRVVIAEGATEMILLPSLIRASIEEDFLDYQVAPGLAEVPIEFYPNLDLEGARVAYLVDGDSSGSTLRRGLVKSGVPNELVITLPLNGIENAIDAACYLDAIVDLIAESGMNISADDTPDLNEPQGESWAKIIDRWAASKSIKMPSKVAIACWLVDRGKAIPSDVGRTILSNIHQSLTEALDPSALSRPQASRNNQ